jgi:radical SAM protein with 4Fe4S-binding SPASM domain
MESSLVDSAGGSAPEFLKRFGDRLAARRVPVTGMIEITSRCNLRCVHCYLGPQEEQQRKRAAELSTREVTTLLDEMAASGTLHLTLTGGDPMMRPDFPEIYRHAKLLGMRVTVFCDGVLVTDRIIELFRELPPATVEVSIYGASAETYEAVTRVPGSFPKFMAGMRRLLEAGLPVALKSVLMMTNRHEFPAMTRMAKEWGVGFRFDSAIFPCLPDQSAKPLDLRVGPEEAVAIEMADPERRASLATYFEAHDNLPPRAELYQCGAGLTSFYVDPFGALSPCVMTTRYRYDIRGRSGAFAERWRDDVGELRSRRAENPEHGCNSCAVRAACSGCSAFFALETGREDVKSDYVCETTQHRVRVLRDELAHRKGLVQLRVLENTTP